ncbi:UNVERIFIED_CONTAM: hypothetical protein Sangu_3112600 [Sesamum angustifolium]|uniref:Aminotransferase-like plant mobile domain-containing protein n=1 Tax=Sesamum angustifolium TaxID=2727405 RepID=A0AAW2K6J8_9LAMI
MKQNEFIWTPYGGEGPDVQSLPIYALRTPWHIKCPLIHYAIVEIHHPERVLRQFGMIQDIPPNPPVSERRLHTLDRRGRHEQDWASFHRDYIIQWNDVQSLMVVRPEIENDRDTVPDYMNWFRQITRIQISHEIESATTPGYRPVNISDADYLPPSNSSEIMNFLETHYPLVSGGAVHYETGPSNARDEAGPSNARNEAGPSNAYTPTNTAYTVDSDNSYLPFIGDESTYTVTPDHRIYHGVSPVPFEDLDVPS